MVHYSGLVDTIMEMRPNKLTSFKVKKIVGDVLGDSVKE